ncbi:MAG: carbohydrate-binding domain-containing protein [Paludibacteraceae bacterium]|nr:carbohydrate-binding domain-containing protein [Paludibacteraceae bacterium]
MKKRLILSATSLAALISFAQDKMNIYLDGSSESFNIEDINLIKFVDGVMHISGNVDKEIKVPEISYADFSLDASKSDTIFVTFDGDKVSVNDYIYDNISFSADRANVTFTSAQDKKSVVYYLSGSSTDGSFSITPDRAFTLVMDNLSLSSKSSSPIVINLGSDGESYATNVELKGSSKLSDAQASSYKGCIYAKSKLKFGELGGNGELSISGNTKHAINSSKKTEFYAGTVNITSAAGDGLNSDGLQMYGGKLNISGVTGDGVDASESILIENGDFVFNSSADDVKALKSDSSIVVKGGKVDITMTGAAAKGLKTSLADIEIAGGEIIMSIDGTSLIADGDTSYSAAIKTDKGVVMSNGKIDFTLGKNAIASKGITADGDVTIKGGVVNITNDGGYYTGATTSTSTGNTGGFGGWGGGFGGSSSKTSTDYTEGRCIKGNNVYLTAGEITLTTSNGAKGVKADADLIIGAGKADNSTLTINVTTNGTATSSSSSSSSNRPGGFGGGMSDGNSNKYAGNPKAFVGENITVNSGTIVVDAKDDAFHANSNLVVEGGNLTVDTSDDGLHSEEDLTINNGTIRVKSAYEGLEGANIYINGGYLHITTTDDCLNVTTDNTGMLRITGGQMWACSSSGDHDCLDSNGSIEMTGGLVIACGSSPIDAGDGSNCYQKHTGGTLLVLGPSSAGMWNQDVKPTCANSITNTSCSVSAGATLCVANTSGDVIAACKVPVALSKILFAYGSSLNGYSFYTTTSDVDLDLFENQYKEKATISSSSLSQLSSGSSNRW